MKISLVIVFLFALVTEIPTLKAKDRECLIFRDSFGIPHLKTETERELYASWGYIHAFDRAFQMEFMRRVGYGTLSEVVGLRGIDILKIQMSV